MSSELDELRPRYDLHELDLQFMHLRDTIHAINVAKGWHDDTRSFGEGIALIHSEVSEALEAYRDHGTVTRYRFNFDGDGGNGYAYSDPNSVNFHNWISSGGVPKPEGVASEMADIIIRVIDECDRQGIDLAAALDEKIRFNATRPHRHGGKSL